LRASDFRGYAPEWVAPLATRYRDHDVRVMPPNSYGLYLLLQLMALDQATLATTPLDSPERVAALVRAAQAAFHVGNRAVADPRFAPEPAAPLLGAAGRDRLRGAAAARPPNRGGTAVISVMDPAGNGVTIVQSIFLVFGSGVSDAKTGILLSNRMIGFTNEPGHPNAVAPRKRPAHTLCPVMVFGKHGLRFALGTPGGPGQTITLAQVLQALLDANRPLREAITAPRWSMDLGAAALVEATMPPSTIAGAQRLGIALEQAKPDSPFFGSAEGIERAADGTLTGVADFRRDAGVAGA
jgi:gamma-glutamyltranspeptidase/glutathione hydrolase